KSILQEEVQKEGKNVRYEILERIGPEHQPEFITGLYIDEVLASKGKGTSRKAAEQEAAYLYLTSRHET
ncbi:MAG: putative dsRNA-binding protein, partial [bacterium]